SSMDTKEVVMRAFMIKCSLVSVAVSLPLLGFANDAKAQNCGQYLFCSEDPYMHKVPCCAVFSGYNNIHDYCSYCAFGQCHINCGFGLLMPKENDAYQQVLVAAEQSDLKALVSLAPQTGNRVHFNPIRSAMQV